MFVCYLGGGGGGRKERGAFCAREYTLVFFMDRSKIRIKKCCSNIINERPM